MPTFVNESKPIDRPADYYGYDHPSPLLFVWNRTFQALISQAGTFIVTGKFHEQQCAIYKCEGGCTIAGVGSLVLGTHQCYLDHGGKSEKENKIEELLNALITHVVLSWDPMNPISSMMNLAVDFITKKSKYSCTLPDLQSAMEKSKVGGVFGGDSLTDFFDWNPFAKAPIDRKYLRFCMVTFDGKSEEEVDQKYADEDLGEDLLKRMKAKIKENRQNSEWLLPLCCSPHRSEKGLSFWINTGRSTNIDGWKTQEEIETFLSGDGLLTK